MMRQKCLNQDYGIKESLEAIEFWVNRCKLCGSYCRTKQITIGTVVVQ